VTALEIRIIGYALMALGIIGVTAYATHRLDDARYEALQVEYADYRTQVQADAVTAQKAYATALQAQIDHRTNLEASNAQTIASLTSQADAARQSADFAQRLLASSLSAGSAAAGHPVPGAGGQPGAHDPTAGAGDQSTPDLARDVADSASECRDAIERLAALQVELAPQLRSNP